MLCFFTYQNINEQKYWTLWTMLGKIKKMLLLLGRVCMFHRIKWWDTGFIQKSSFELIFSCIWFSAFMVMKNILALIHSMEEHQKKPPLFLIQKVVELPLAEFELECTITWKFSQFFLFISLSLLFFVSKMASWCTSHFLHEHSLKTWWPNSGKVVLFQQWGWNTFIIPLKWRNFARFKGLEISLPTFFFFFFCNKLVSSS